MHWCIMSFRIQAEAAEAPQLWTHQRESRSSLAQLSPEKWRKLKTELYEELRGARFFEEKSEDMSDMSCQICQIYVRYAVFL